MKCLVKCLVLSFVWIFDTFISIDAKLVYNYENSAVMVPTIPGPFTNPTLNLVLYALCAVIIILLVMMCCCILCCYFCRKQEDERLEVTPSELVAVGATPSDLKAANISPSVLKDSGASYDQMAQLGATPSQLVEAGAGKQDLERLGATRSQLSHVGYKDYQKQSMNEKKRSSPKPVSEAQSEILKLSTTKPENNEKTDSKRGFHKRSEHNMSQLAEKMAHKLRDKPKKVTKPTIESEVQSEINEKPSIAPSAQPTKMKAPADDTISTISVSPQKKAAALKATDDSMSVAMGPPSKS